MQTYQSIEQRNDLTEGRIARRIFTILSWYPFIWTLVILVSGLLKSHSLLLGVMSTLTIFIFGGTLSWLFLVIYLPLKNRISKQQLVQNIAIISAGIITAYFAAELDIFGSGVKYLD